MILDDNAIQNLLSHPVIRFVSSLVENGSCRRERSIALGSTPLNASGLLPDHRDRPVVTRSFLRSSV